MANSAYTDNVSAQSNTKSDVAESDWHVKGTWISFSSGVKSYVLQSNESGQYLAFRLTNKVARELRDVLNEVLGSE